MKLEVRLLQSDDAREDFSCGDIELDRFFQRYAGQNQFRHHIGTTYVALVRSRIAGFVTVSATGLNLSVLPKSKRRNLPRYSLPALRLSRLAVDRRYQGRGLGLGLLRSVFSLALEMSVSVGCVGVVVDAKPNAIAFYKRFGFVPLETTQGTLESRPEPLPMFLEIAAISPG